MTVQINGEETEALHMLDRGGKYSPFVAEAFATRKIVVGEAFL
jgi:hypothetical protein